MDTNINTQILKDNIVMDGAKIGYKNAIDFLPTPIPYKYLQLLHYTTHRKCYERRNKHPNLRCGHVVKIQMKTNRCHRWMHRQRWIALLFLANQCTMLISYCDDPIAMYVVWYLVALFFCRAWINVNRIADIKQSNGQQVMKQRTETAKKKCEKM